MDLEQFKCARCGEVKARTSFTPRRDRRRGVHSFCKVCLAGATAASTAKDPGHLAKRRARYAAAAPVLRAKAVARYHARQPEARAKNKAWKIKNPDKVRTLVRQRKAHIRRATPPWADRKAINAIYMHAQQISRDTGIEHHVDHEIPLRGRGVCGLHVENNLRVITAEANLSKRNAVADT